MKKTTKSFLQKPSTTGVLLAVLTVAFSVVGLLLVQAPLQNPQDIRRQASIDNGVVEISNTVTPGTKITVGQETEVVFKVTTHSVPTDGIQVLFNVISDSFDTLTADVITGTGLQAAGTQVERTQDGFLVQALALPAQIGQPFTTAEPAAFLRVSFIPTQAGTITFNFDREESISILHGSNPLEDKLKHVPSLTLTVNEEPSDDPEVSPSPSPSASPDVSPSPSPSPAVGGIEVVSCNDNCSSNDECGINQRCYDLGEKSVCRLAINPTNNQCSTTVSGPEYSCNQGCATTNECQDGLFCWNNKCRDPQNTEDTACTALTTEEEENLALSCNTACSTNDDCDINLRCYQGACRLATNVSSTSCTPSTVAIISTTYSAPKGADSQSENTGKPAEIAETTTDATEEATTETTETTPEQENVIPGMEKADTLENIPLAENESALDLLRQMMSTPDSALPLIVIGAGIGLFILALIVLLIKKALGNKKSSGTPVTPATKPAAPQDIEKRQNIETPLTTARSMTTPTASMPTQATLEKQVAATQAPAQASATESKPASSMMERVKSKGITPPSGPTVPTNKS